MENENGLLFSLRRSIVPIYTKIMYDFSITFINKCFEFQNDWLKIIRPIACNFVLYHYHETQKECTITALLGFHVHQTFINLFLCYTYTLCKAW